MIFPLFAVLDEGVFPEPGCGECGATPDVCVAGKPSHPGLKW